jgi:hypothetical protein
MACSLVCEKTQASEAFFGRAVARFDKASHRDRHGRCPGGRGDDGHVHYDLLIISVVDGLVTLTSAEVMDEAGTITGGSRSEIAPQSRRVDRGYPLAGIAANFR